MTQPEPTTDPRTRHERRRVTQRAVAAVVALAMALAVSLVLVPGSPAESAPRFNIRCDKLIKGIKGPTDFDDLPGGGRTTPLNERIRDYRFRNTAEPLRATSEPSAAELAALTGSHRSFEAGTLDHMLRRWKAYLAGNPKLTWAAWKASYIPNQANDARGDAYHRNVAKRLKLRGGDWICEDNRLWREEGLTRERRFDSVNRKLKIAYEVKSGNSRITDRQLRLDRQLVRKGWKVVYITSRELRQPTLDRMARYGVQHATLRSTAVQTNPPKSSSNAMNAPCASSPKSTLSTLAASCPRRSTAGPAKDLAQRSGRSPALAREVQRVQNTLGSDGRRQGFMPRRPGGIDWTSLELKYVSDDPENDDYGYAFSAGELPDDGEAEPGFGGEAALDLSSDALFTWLALDPQQFWVNLNPDTPETVIDEQFATTDAGRVLLQADLEFKRTIADGMNPDTETGKQFWDSMERTEDGLICHDWYRFWVDPRPAKVRVDGDQLYILDAPLRAQIEPTEVEWDLPGQDLCADAPEDVVERNNQLIVDTYAPLLEEAVNHDPEYADLRRVYTARVAAEWIKDRDAQRPGAFHDVIGTGDVSAWPARTEWDPQDVFDAYLERLETPLYRYEWTHGDMEYWLEITGGVEFPDAPRAQTSKEDFEREHPRLPRTVQGARHEATSLPVEAQDTVGTLAEGAETVAWLGGGTPLPVEEPDPGPTDPPGDGDDGGGPGGPGDGPGGGPGGNEPGDGPGGGGDDRPGDDDAAGSGGREPLPPRADSPSYDVVRSSGPMPATGFGDAWLVPVALVLVFAGLTLVLVRRRWTGGR